jgi:hypothetical protein
LHARYGLRLSANEMVSLAQSFSNMHQAVLATAVLIKCSRLKVFMTMMNSVL